jgi:pyroglutamyl-peptidase
VLSIERIALNLCDARIADNDGVQPRAAPVVRGAPDAYFATLPATAIAAALRAAGLPAEVSQNAGGFVCNHLFYTLMHLAAGQSWRAGFLHVPRNALPLDDVVRGISIAIETAVAVSPASG